MVCYLMFMFIVLFVGDNLVVCYYSVPPVVGFMCRKKCVLFKVFVLSHCTST